MSQVAVGQDPDSNHYVVSSVVPLDFTALGDPPSVSGHDPDLTSVSNDVSPQSLPSYRGSQNPPVSMQTSQATTAPRDPITVYETVSNPSNNHVDRSNGSIVLAFPNSISNPAQAAETSVHHGDYVSNNGAPHSEPFRPFIAMDSDRQAAAANDNLVSVPELTLTPAEVLSFTGPFNTGVSTILELANPTSGRVLYEIKTTKPHCYYAEPNYGRLDPGTKKKVRITLRPQERDPAAEKASHKFLIQSCFASPDVIDFASIPYVVRQSTNKCERKLTCNFCHNSVPQLFNLKITLPQ